MKMVHVKVENDSVCENVCKICGQAKGCEVVERAKVAQENQWKEEGTEVDQPVVSQ